MCGQVAQDAAGRSADPRIAALAAKQHGVVGLAQLLAAGLTRRQVQYRLAQRRLHPLHRGVYSVGHPLLGPDGRDLAAVLACGDGATLGYRSAAAHWGIRPSSAAAVDVIVPTRTGRAWRKGIRIHRVELPPTEVTVHGGIPVTTVARTLLDLAAAVSPHALERAIHGAERQRLFDLRAVEAVRRRNANRPGSRALAAAIDGYREPAMTRSALERVLLRVCAKHDLPTPEVNGSVSGYEVDFLWPAERLVVETDGREDHLTHTAFEEDRARDARLTALGYRVVRFTRRRLRREPDVVVGLLRSLLQPPRSISSTR